MNTFKPYFIESDTIFLKDPKTAFNTIVLELSKLSNVRNSKKWSDRRTEGFIFNYSSPEGHQYYFNLIRNINENEIYIEDRENNVFTGEGLVQILNSIFRLDNYL